MFLYLIPLLTTLTLLTAAAAVYQIQMRGRRAAQRLQRVVDGGGQGTVDALLDTHVPVVLRPLTFLAWLMPSQVY